MLKLYNAPVSTCSQKVRMALFEKGLEWQDHPMIFANGDHLADWYLALNPNGVVPTLVHDGDPIIDSSVICEYLEDVFPDVPLRPRDAKDCARMRAWRQYVDEVPTTAIRVPSFQQVFRNIWADKSEEDFRAHAEKLPLRKHLYAKMVGGSFSEQDVTEAMEKLTQTLDRMEDMLDGGQPWLMGQGFGLADICIMPTIVRLQDLGYEVLWEDRPNVTAWLKRIQERPAFSKTYPPEARHLTAKV